MRLADRGRRNSPRCATSHTEFGPCDCQEVFLQDLVHRSLLRQPVDWRTLYVGELPRVREMLIESHKALIEEGDLVGAGVPNAVLAQLQIIEDNDGFMQLDEVWT